MVTTDLASRSTDVTSVLVRIVVPYFVRISEADRNSNLEASVTSALLSFVLHCVGAVKFRLENYDLPINGSVRFLSQHSNRPVESVL